MKLAEQTIDFIRDWYQSKDYIALHEPRFNSIEKELMLDCIDSTYVSSVGKYVDQFERMTENFTEAKRAVVTVNGTSAIHVILELLGAGPGTEVLTQSLSFIATANAISYTGAEPVFIDVDLSTLGLSPDAVKDFLEEYTELRDDGYTYNKESQNRIVACVPMHTFGHPARIDELVKICEKYNILVVEDAAESLGSTRNGIHTGIFGVAGALSYNGNKIVTTGGGGAIITNNLNIGARLKHITTTAKIPHPWEFYHDEIGYNYRMPNINAALGCAQMSKLDIFLKDKRELASHYKDFFKNSSAQFVDEPANCCSNFWLNAIILESKEQRDYFLKEMNDMKVMVRPIWKLLSTLPMYTHCSRQDLSNSEWLEDRVVNLPSSVRITNK